MRSCFKSRTRMSWRFLLCDGVYKCGRIFILVLVFIIGPATKHNFYAILYNLILYNFCYEYCRARLCWRICCSLQPIRTSHAIFFSIDKSNWWFTMYMRVPNETANKTGYTIEFVNFYHWPLLGTHFRRLLNQSSKPTLPVTASASAWLCYVKIESDTGVTVFSTSFHFSWIIIRQPPLSSPFIMQGNG